MVNDNPSRLSLNTFSMIVVCYNLDYFDHHGVAKWKTKVNWRNC